MGRIMKGAAGMKREKAEEIAQKIMNKAEEDIEKRGEPDFADIPSYESTCDLKTGKPKPEFFDVIKQTRDDLVDMGMPYADS